MNKLRAAAEVIIILICLALLWMVSHKREIPRVQQPVEAKKSSVVSKEEKTAITPAVVKVYRKSVKEKLPVPEEVKSNESVHVLDASILPSEDRPMTVTHLFDENTGETKTIYNLEDYPLFQAKNETEVSLILGVKNGMKFAGRLSGSREFFQIKSARIGALATVDSDGQAMAGVSLTYRFK